MGITIKHKAENHYYSQAQANNAVIEDIKQFAMHSVQLAHHWFERRKTRQQLAEMPSCLLKDIGLTEEERQKEINKGFWH